MTQIVLTNGFEGGTNGTNISVANSGGASGDAFDTVVINNTATNGGASNFTYSTAAATRGVMGMAATVGTANTYIRHTQGSPAGPRGIASIKFLYSGLPTIPTTATNTLFALRSASAAGAVFQINASGKVIVLDAANAIVSALTSATTLTSGQVYRLYGAITAGTTTTNGTIEWRLYNSADTLVESLSVTVNNAGTANPAVVRYYAPTNWGASTYLADEFSLATSDVTTFWPSLPSASVPVISVNVTQGLVDASASTGDTLSFGIAALTNPGSVTAKDLGSGRFFVPQASAASTWRVTITQGDGQTTSTDITVAAAGISGALRYYNGTTWITM